MAPPRSSTALHATTSTSGHATETVQTRGAKRAVGLTTEPAAGELLHHRVAVGVRPPAVQHATQAPRVHPAHKLSAPRRIGPSVADNAPAGPAEQKGTNVRTCLSGSRLHSSNAGRISWYSHSRKPSPGLLILSSVLGGSSIARSFWRIAASERTRRPTPSSDSGFFVVQWSMSYQLSNAPARRNWL